jgi:hypothetical protein
MKGRESGMPLAELWEKFFVPDKILAVMGLGGTVITYGLLMKSNYGPFLHSL